MKTIQLIGLASALAVLISLNACSAKTNVSVPDPQQGGAAQTNSAAPAGSTDSSVSLDGTWGFDCSHQMTSEVTFAGKEFHSRTVLHADAACKTPIQTDERKGTLELGSPTSAAGISPIDLSWVDASGNLHKSYDIVQRREGANGSELRFGMKPGKTPETRPTALLEALPYAKR